MRRTCHAVILALLLAMLAGCAGQSGPSGGGTGAYGGNRTGLIHRVQYAQNQSEDDEDFEDLFGDGEDLAIEEDYDPLELPNRFIFAINEALDFILFRPAAEVYRFLLPQVVQDSVQNFMRNLKAPVIWANDLFQGKDEDASTMAARFLVNSTLGLAGLFDVADAWWDLEFHKNDFGRTLGYYGWGPGPYLVLPLFGPSNVRDGIGLGVDTLLDPWPYVLDAANVDNSFEILLARRIIDGLDERSRNIETVDDLRQDSVDFYARIRSLFLQHRASLIRGDGEDEFLGADEGGTEND